MKLEAYAAKIGDTFYPEAIFQTAIKIYLEWNTKMMLSSRQGNSSSLDLEELSQFVVLISNQVLLLWTRRGEFNCEENSTQIFSVWI